MKTLCPPLVLVAVALATATPVFAWDKAPTPQKRLEILAGAAKRADQGELAACFAPPFDKEVMQEFLSVTIEYEKNLARLFQVAGEKFGPEGLTALGPYEEAVTEYHFLCGTTITTGAVKEEKDGVTALAQIHFVYKDDSFKGDHGLKLTKVNDDWRVLFDEDAWPGGDSDKNFTELSAAVSKLGIELDRVCKALQEDRLTKEEIEQSVKNAKLNIKRYFTVMKEAHATSVEVAKDKIATAAAEAARKEAAKKAAEEEAARKEAKKDKDAKDPPKKDAPKKDVPAATPTPEATKTDAKDKDKKKDGDEEEPKKEPDNTGMFIVFGILGVVCLVVVGILISKMRGEKAAGGGGGRSGGVKRGGGRGNSSGRSERGSSGERGSGRKRPGKGKRSSSGGDEDES